VTALVGQEQGGSELTAGISVASGGTSVTGIGMGLGNGAMGGWAAQAVAANRISSKIIEVFIGMLLCLLPVKTQIASIWFHVYLAKVLQSRGLNCRRKVLGDRAFG
jgi:hypothetical protein